MTDERFQAEIEKRRSACYLARARARQRHKAIQGELYAIERRYNTIAHSRRMYWQADRALSAIASVVRHG